jgi:hypothetical protein
LTWLFKKEWGQRTFKIDELGEQKLGGRNIPGMCRILWQPQQSDVAGLTGDRTVAFASPS